jgi:magnesium-transporting ATPase (P-type)
MFCSKCGNQVNDTDVFCNKCGNQLRAAEARAETGAARPETPVQGAAAVSGIPQIPYVPTYLVWSILATIFCCLPGGVVAIIYSAMVSSKLSRGDYAGAVSASRNAKIWCWVSFVVGIVVQILFFFFFAAMLQKALQQGKYV